MPIKRNLKIAPANYTKKDAIKMENILTESLHDGTANEEEINLKEYEATELRKKPAID